MEDNNESSPQLTGVVIITLPPSNNPSLGKTITAYTLSNYDDLASTPPRSIPPPGRSISLSLHGNLYKSSKFIFPILLISFIALWTWSTFNQETRFELREGNEDDRRNNKSQHTFIFPLYQKTHRSESEGSILGEIELKLGRFVGSDRRPVSKAVKDPKSVSATSQVDASGVIPVRGNIFPDGLYYTYLHFGSPPRPYFLDVDTGSDLTWIQCDAPCTSCAKGPHPFYKPLKASILPPMDSYCVEVQVNQRNKYCDSCHQCDYEIEYADHSSSMGVLVRDELYLNIANGSLVHSKTVFGCAYDQQGLLLNTMGKTDGILGLSRARISLPSQLASQGIVNNVVGHCLGTGASSSGYLFFGDDFVPHRQMTWVPMLSSNGLNSCRSEVMEISYGSKQIKIGSLGNGQGNLVFDSGSSYTYFTEQAYNDLLSVLNDVSDDDLVRDMSDTSLPICWKYKFPLRSVEEVKHIFKPLNLQFGHKWLRWWTASKILQIPSEGYLVRNRKGNVCLGILDGKSVHDGSTFILGDISLRGFLFVYDNVNDKIGWLGSDCSRPQRFETHSLY